MGSWGTKPFQNDNALDWLGLLEDGILDSIIRALRQPKPEAKRGSGYHEAIAAAALLNKLSTSGARPNLSCIAYPDTFEEAKETVTMILQQKAWMSAWSNPNEARAELERLIRSLDERQSERRRLNAANQARIITVRRQGRKRSGSPASATGRHAPKQRSRKSKGTT